MTAGHMNASTRSRCEAEPDFAGFGYNLDNRACARRDAGAAGFEILLRLLRLARAAVVDLELALPAGALAYAPHAAACDALAVPALSWELSWPGARRPARWPEVAVRGRVIPERHPNWAFHQLVADWLAQNWRALAADDDAGPAPAREPAGTFAAAGVVCSARRLRRRGAARRGEAAGVARDGWRVADDAPGKRGWAARRGAAITFAVEAAAVWRRVPRVLGPDHGPRRRGPRRRAARRAGRAAAELDGVVDGIPANLLPPTTTGLPALRRAVALRAAAGAPAEAALELAGLAAANVKDRYAAEDELKRARAGQAVGLAGPALVWRNLTFVLLDPGTRVIRYLTTC
ncbi:cGMP-dependent protein kinase [Aureococcus anophagefferens]|nr:cGMP-dependent protein kinase [Aureococcus anophagefferens]